MSAELMMSRIETSLMHCIASSGATVGCDIAFTAEGEKVINIGLYFNDGKPLHFSLSYLGVEGSQPSFIRDEYKCRHCGSTDRMKLVADFIKFTARKWCGRFDYGKNQND